MFIMQSKLPMGHKRVKKCFSHCLSSCYFESLFASHNRWVFEGHLRGFFGGSGRGGWAYRVTVGQQISGTNRPSYAAKEPCHNPQPTAVPQLIKKKSIRSAWQVLVDQVRQHCVSISATPQGLEYLISAYHATVNHIQLFKTTCGIILSIHTRNYKWESVFWGGPFLHF